MIILLVWLWLPNVGPLFGAELNDEIEHRKTRELIPEPTVQEPPALRLTRR